jgi:Ca2+-binding RTX toxin-like protein
MSRLSRSPRGRRRSLNWRRANDANAQLAPVIVQELEDRVLLAAEINVLGNGFVIASGDTTPATFDGTVFADTEVNNTATLTFTIQSTGVDDFDVMSATIVATGGFAAGAASPVGTVTGSGGETTASFTFTPTAIGAFTTTVTITSDADNTPVFTFDLMGTGVVTPNDAPTFTSNATFSRPENVTTVTTVVATDPQVPAPQTLTYSIEGGADQALFSINDTSGVLVFDTAPDFENPADADGDNIYNVQVGVTDSIIAGPVTQDLTITITNNSPVTQSVTLPAGGGTYTVDVVGNNVEVNQTAPTAALVASTSLNDLGNVILYGSTGNDLVTLGALTGFSGTVTFNGGAGNDSFDASATMLNTSVSGGSGRDTVVGGGGNDTFNGGSGSDSASGGGGNDSLTGGAGNDTMSGGAGDDFLNGNSGSDLLTGDADDDTLLGGGGTDTVDGGADDDFVNGQGGPGDIVAGGGGADTLLGDASDIKIAGTAGMVPDAPADPPGLVGGTLNVALPTSGGPFTVAVNAGQLQVTNMAGDVVGEAAVADVGAVSITGSSSDDVVNLGDLTGFSGSVSFSGGTGNDSLDSSAGNIDTNFTGGSGNDVLDGGGGRDIFNGGDGDDVASGGAGNDMLTGGAGADSFSGDSGDDFLNGNQGNDTLLGGDGNDTLLGGSNTDLLDGNAGDDLVNGQGGFFDTVAGGGGNDSLRGDSSDVLIDGSSGSTPADPGNGDGDVGSSGTTLTAVLPSSGGTFFVAVDAGGNLQVIDQGGTALLQNDIAFTVITSIVINGSSSNDTVFFTAGNGLEAFTGTVTFNGFGGDDYLDVNQMNAINVVFNGGAGNDELAGENTAGTANVTGGSGNDTLNTGSGNDNVNGGSGNDSINVGAGNDAVRGEEGNDIIIGGDGNDILNGNSGSDTISGDDDNDTLYGGGSNDSLDGGLGNDTIRGHSGIDTLIGGGGIDKIVQ